MVDFSFLSGAAEIWEEWRFEPWKDGSAEGLQRRVTMVKGGRIGEVARYYADDYIVWKYDNFDAERLLREAKPQSDLFMQRYLFLRENGSYTSKKRSLLFGFRGFAEAHFFVPGDDVPAPIQDLGFLVNAALRKLKK